MPFKPEYEGEFPSLGPLVADWIEAFLRVPDREVEGQPLVLRDSQYSFLVNLYRMQLPFGESLFYRRAARIGPKGSGKSPTGAMLALCGIGAPIVPAGFDAYGRPVGKPQASPLVQIAGVSEAQAGNVYEFLEAMVGLDGPLFDAIPDLDIAQGRITIAGKTVVRPVSSNAGTRQGQRVTMGILEETQHWTRGNRGTSLASVIRGNVDKTNGLTIEMSNAPEPGENSVCEKTIVAYMQGKEGRAGVLLDMVAPSRAWDWSKPEERMAHLREVYGDSAKEEGGWVDVQRIYDSTYDVVNDLSWSKRMFGNVMAAGQGQWIEPVEWSDCTDKDKTIVLGEQIAMGFDGSRTGDSTVLRGCRISDGHLFTLGMWQRPAQLDRDQDWEVPQHEVQMAVKLAMGNYKVLRFYADPPYWRDEVDGWAAEWPDIVAAWNTNRDTAMAAALERLHTAITTHALTHDDDLAVAEHYGNAFRSVRGSSEKPLVLVRKETPFSTRKIDSVVTDALAYEARWDAIVAGIPEDKPAGYHLYHEL